MYGGRLIDGPVGLVEHLTETAEQELRFRQRDALVCDGSLNANPMQTDDCGVRDWSRKYVLDVEATN